MAVRVEGVTYAQADRENPLAGGFSGINPFKITGEAIHIHADKNRFVDVKPG